jgi:hypothetical protein
LINVICYYHFFVFNRHVQSSPESYNKNKSSLDSIFIREYIPFTTCSFALNHIQVRGLIIRSFQDYQRPSEGFEPSSSGICQQNMLP